MKDELDIIFGIEDPKVNLDELIKSIGIVGIEKDPNLRNDLDVALQTGSYAQADIDRAQGIYEERKYSYTNKVYNDIDDILKLGDKRK